MINIRVGLDLNRDGDIDWDGVENITQYVKSATWSLGTDGMNFVAQDGKATLSLDNQGGLFNPENELSFVYNNLFPGMALFIDVLDSTETWNRRWEGIVNKFTIPTGISNHTIQMQALQGLGIFNDTDIRGFGTLQDASVSYIIEQLSGYYSVPGASPFIIGVTPIGEPIGSVASTDIQDGSFSIPFFNPSKRGPFINTRLKEGSSNLLGIIGQLCQIENGYFFVSEQSVLKFIPLTAMLGTPEKTINVDTDAQSSVYEVSALGDDYANNVSIEWTEWVPVNSGTIFEHEQKTTVPANETKLVDVSIPSNVIIGNVTSTICSYSGGTVGAQSTYSFDDNKIQVALTNTHVSEAAEVSTITFIGDGAYSSESDNEVAVNIDSVSRYGLRRKDITNPYIQDTLTASTVAGRTCYLLSASPFRITEFSLPLNGPDGWLETGLLSLGDFVNLSATSVSHRSKNYLITGSKYSWTPQNLRVSYSLRPTVDEVFFTIGSEIGGPKVIL